jgi:hypothetical protein
MVELAELDRPAQELQLAEVELAELVEPVHQEQQLGQQQGQLTDAPAAAAADVATAPTLDREVPTRGKRLRCVVAMAAVVAIAAVLRSWRNAPRVHTNAGEASWAAGSNWTSLYLWNRSQTW